MTALAGGHVSFRILVDLGDGRLSSSRAGSARAHLGTGCRSCEADVAWLARTISAIAAGAPERPPAAEETRAIALHAPAWGGRRDDEVLLGVLILDQPSEFATAVRGASGETRRLLFRVGDYELDASLVAQRAGTDLLAQVIPAGDDPDRVVTGTATVRSAGRVRSRAAIAADGRFTFRGLAPGVYTVEGRVDARRFVLPPLHVE